jgi:lysophospholipase L1-like esterase
MKPFGLTLLLLLMSGPLVADPLDFAQKDRVVLLGSTLIEREQKYGDWELALMAKNSGKAITIRNLGWSGDTVHCESRGSFDGPPKGFANTIALVKELKPQVIVLCYGHNESFDGPAGVSRFSEGLAKLVSNLEPTKARFVLMSPTPFEDTPPLKDVKLRNENLALYRDVLQKFAEEKKLGFVDLFAKVQSLKTNKLTENGLHYTPEGYRQTASLFGPMPEKAEAIRAVILEKNQLFFHRWRPQNFTYLFGFRKHEQGNNGVEIPQFDPLVDEKDKLLHTMLKK